MGQQNQGPIRWTKCNCISSQAPITLQLISSLNKRHGTYSLPLLLQKHNFEHLSPHYSSCVDSRTKLTVKERSILTFDQTSCVCQKSYNASTKELKFHISSFMNQITKNPNQKKKKNHQFEIVTILSNK